MKNLLIQKLENLDKFKEIIEQIEIKQTPRDYRANWDKTNPDKYIGVRLRGKVSYNFNNIRKYKKTNLHNYI